jgi:hypothetical protein
MSASKKKKKKTLWQDMLKIKSTLRDRKKQIEEGIKNAQ